MIRIRAFLFANLSGFCFSASGVAKSTVFCGRLGGVARPAEPLPVGSLPEQRHITLVRDDVVNIRGSNNQVAGRTVTTQRMLGQVARSSLLPLVVVATGRAGFAGFLAGEALKQVQVIVAVARVARELVAALGVAGFLGA